MTDPDDLLASIADASQAARQGQTPAPAKGAGNLIGQISKQVAKEAAAARAPQAAITSIESLLGWNENNWRTFLDKAPTDALVACLVDASESFRARVVNALDDESRIWIKQNLKLLTEVTPALRDHARDQVLSAANHLVSQGTLPHPGERPARREEPAAAPSPAAPAPRPASIDVGFGPVMTSSSRPSYPTPLPSDLHEAVATDAVAPLSASAGVGMGAEMTFRRPAGDPTVSLVAELVAVAKGKDPGQLTTIAGHLDQPLLVEGLRLIAQGIDANQLATALHAAQADMMSDYARQLDVMREGLLAIRFGEGVDEFRRRVDR